MANLRDLYTLVLQGESDIQEHLGLLRGLAQSCKTVVEFGFRTGVSTRALLMGAERVVSYDVSDCKESVAKLKAATKKFEFHKKSSIEADIPECEMLFIDSRHDYHVLREELAKHHHKVSKWIVCHDVEKFGKHGQTANDPGLLKAIDEFLERNQQWRIMLFLKNNNGLMIMERRG